MAGMAARKQKPSSLPPVRRWTFRLAAILLGLSPWLAGEILLRAAGVGSVSEARDPYLGFSEMSRLFVESDDQFITNAARHAYFRPESFTKLKPKREFRIFCLGGSTVQGRPYAIETSFTTWLELSLQVADSRRDWNVINCGGVSYASYRLVPILREILTHYEPDLIVLYTGHNEFLEDRTYRELKHTATGFAVIHQMLSRLHTYNSARWQWMRWTGEVAEDTTQATTLPGEVNAILDYYGGLAEYHRDDQWRKGAVEHYRHNLSRMIEMARQYGVSTILVNPVSNLRDSPPFKFLPDESLAESDRQEFERMWNEARQEDDARERCQKLERAVAVDGRHAAAHFALAKCFDALGDGESAAREYRLAMEEDICPLRMIEPLHQTLFDVAQSMKTPLVDVRAAIAARSQIGTPGSRWLVDHVHPSINGHQLIAELLLTEMMRLKHVRPDSDWKTNCRPAFQAHLESLNAAYFVHGQQRLEGLRYWTQGKAEKNGQPNLRHSEISK